jgi:hypothetical protein
VVRDYVAVVGESFLADTAHAVLSHNLTIEQFSHFAVGAEFPVPAGRLRTVDAPDADLAPSPFLPDLFPATAESGTVDGTNLVAMKSHGSSPLFMWSSAGGAPRAEEGLDRVQTMMALISLEFFQDRGRVLRSGPPHERLQTLHLLTSLIPSSSMHSERNLFFINYMSAHIK